MGEPGAVVDGDRDVRRIERAWARNQRWYAAIRSDAAAVAYSRTLDSDRPGFTNLDDETEARPATVVPVSADAHRRLLWARSAIAVVPEVPAAGDHRRADSAAPRG